ncbi:MAG: hypothetical protein ABW047_04510 [Nitrospiraceae bacterium]
MKVTVLSAALWRRFVGCRNYSPGHHVILRETSLGRRLAWRRIVLQVIGIALVVAGISVSWPPADDPSLPPTRPFLVLVGILIFIAGVGLERQSPNRQSEHSQSEK